MLLPLNNINHCKNCFCLSAASEAIGLKNHTYAKKFLGEPDLIEKGKTAERFLYFPETVEKAKKELEAHKQKCKNEKGKRTCYLCRKKFEKSELTSGMCLTCKATNIVANFTCKGDCLCKQPEYKRYCALREAIARYGEEIREKYRAKQK